MCSVKFNKTEGQTVERKHAKEVEVERSVFRRGKCRTIFSYSKDSIL